MYLELCSGPVDDKTVEKAIETFEDKDRRETFYKLFKELEMLYEIISPDVFLRPYVENYGKLAVLYQIVKNALAKKVMIIKDLMNKTEDLVKKTVATTGLDTVMKVVRIDDALKADKGGEPPKIIDLGKSLLTASARRQTSSRTLFRLASGQRQSSKDTTIGKSRLRPRRSSWHA